MLRGTETFSTTKHTILSFRNRVIFFARRLSKLMSRIKKQCFTVSKAKFYCFPFKIDHEFGKREVKYIPRQVLRLQTLLIEGKHWKRLCSKAAPLEILTNNFLPPAVETRKNELGHKSVEKEAAVGWARLCCPQNYLVYAPAGWTASCSMHWGLCKAGSSEFGVYRTGAESPSRAAHLRTPKLLDIRRRGSSAERLRCSETPPPCAEVTRMLHTQRVPNGNIRVLSTSSHVIQNLISVC